MQTWKTWRGALAGLAGLLAVGACARTASAASCGDINNSGTIDPGDGVQLLQFVAGLSSPPDGSSLCGGLGIGQCGDLNQDSGVDVSDLIIELNLVAGNPVLFFCSAPPPPLACGSTLPKPVASNVTLPAGCSTFVDGTTFVNAGVVLTVQPGAIVKGRKTSTNGTPSVLVFRRGARINAAGTAVAPIVFTSDQAAGSRSLGDWGGVVFNGNAPVNCPGGECLAEGLTGVAFGGSNANDSSGVLTYARIEYSGIELSADNELNILTMNGVGRNTIMNHIQVNTGFDDGFEWFGGNVNMKYLLASAVADDDFDWQLGYTGAVQFALGIKNIGFHDTNGRHGIEADNNENGFDLAPRSNPRFCNLTLVGTKSQGATAGQAGRRGILFRRGTGGQVWNAIIDDFTEAGVRFQDNDTAEQACVAGPALNLGAERLEMKSSLFFNNGNILQAQGSSFAGPCGSANNLWGLWASTNAVTPALVTDIGTDPVIGEAPYPTAVTAQYVPGAALPAGQNCAALDPFFDSAPFIGAFGSATPGDTGNWLDQGPNLWLSFATD